jgi:hypothetical protein
LIEAIEAVKEDSDDENDDEGAEAFTMIDEDKRS